MASYKSHYNPPRRSEEQTLYPQHAPSTRLPQRSVTPTSTIASSISTSGHSKLQKKKYPRGEHIPVNRGIKNERVPGSQASGSVKARQGTTTPTVPLSRPSPSIPKPKTTRQISSSRLPKPEAFGNTRTPSLASGSSASTADSPRSNLLRRKPSNIGIGSGRQASRGRGESMSSQEDAQPFRGIPGGYKDPFSETVLGISLPPTSVSIAHSEMDLDPLDTTYGEYDGPFGVATDVLPPPNPLYALSTTPSTRYSESPGPFSVSSTPTSMSSYSPGAALTSKTTTRVRQASPLESRPPTARTRTNENAGVRQQQGLSSVRESSTSSSSTSTVLAEGAKQKERTSPARRLPAPPPSPPVRLSSLSPSQMDNQQQSQNMDYLSPTISNTPRFQTPPELAHLADQPQRPNGSRKPSRPSRDGTSEITGLREPSPIIQSNMASFPSNHKRTSSSESKSGIVPTGRSRFGIPSKTSSRNPSPNPSLASGFAPMSRVPTRGSTPEMTIDASHSCSKTVPSPAPSPAKTSRFGFFSRRAKTEPPPAPKLEKKLHRKGPAAGTGHEGYGKYATARGRSGSAISGGSIGKSASAGTTTESLNRTPSSRKSSMTSTASSDMDDFFLDRLTPVVIRGTGSSTELSRSPEPMQSGSSLDLFRSRSEEATKVNTSHGSSQTVLDKSRPILLPSAMSDPVRPPTKKQPFAKRRPSESEDDSKRSFLPSLTSKRASRTSKIMDNKSLKKIPTATAAGDKARKGSSGGSSTRASEDTIPEGKEGRWMKSKKTQAPPAKPPRKWNFFQRAHVIAKAESPVVETVHRPVTSRSVAHYALMDPQPVIDLNDLEQIIQEDDSTSEDTIAPEEIKPLEGEPKAREQERLQSILLPPRPVLPPDFVPPTRSASPKVFLHTEAETQKLKLNIKTPTSAHFPRSPSQSDLTPVTDLSPASSPFRPLSPAGPAPVSLPPAVPISPSVLPPLSPPGPPPSLPPPRPSRLAQVGRIPQVISWRGQERRPSSQSFSRPFIADQPKPVIPSRTSIDSNNSLLVTAGPVEPYPVLQGLDALNHASAIATLSPSAEESLEQSSFFKIPPRKNSEVSYSSSSGVWSFAPTSGTAIIPDPAAPQSEDEVWKEYDDLIDEVLSPEPSKTRLDTEGKRLLDAEQKGLSDLKKHPSLVPLGLKTQSSQNSMSGASNPSLHLRRSRLLAVLHSAQTPTSPLSLSDFLTGYGERNLSVVDPVTGRLSFPSSARISSELGPHNRPSSARSSLPASLTLSARQSKATLASNSDKDRESTIANRYRDTRLMEIAENQADGLVSMANLRFGALMTSKWLSFGRVLFSPVHFELKDPSEDRVLVIDGLGKDWSYYCALTYPEATIYNLGSGTSSPATPANTTAEPWSTLRNHRHISHQSLASPLPFPRGFFACAVLRFPPALPSSVHRSILSECKRVLRPGGYLELSVLDLDLVNMGNRARRAIRGLKVKLQVVDEQVSLRNISDEIMAGLGRKGFTECNRCFVGVPVAGKLPNAEDNDGFESKKEKSSNASNTANGASAPKTPKPEVSFSDLLTGQSSADSSTDDGITDMVARVGRWWYSRCYESLVLPDAGDPGATNPGNLLENSIWKDDSLLRECEKRGTSFRLLIGYAQKPEVGVRRTVSV